LDEADRLLDMGFENTIRHIARLIDERRQIQQVSTFPPPPQTHPLALSL